MLMNLTCMQTSNNFLMKLIKVIVKYCIYNWLLLFVAFMSNKNEVSEVWLVKKKNQSFWKHAMENFVRNCLFIILGKKLKDVSRKWLQSGTRGNNSSHGQHQYKLFRLCHDEKFNFFKCKTIEILPVYSFKQ